MDGRNIGMSFAYVPLTQPWWELWEIVVNAVIVAISILAVQGLG